MIDVYSVIVYCVIDIFNSVLKVIDLVDRFFFEIGSLQIEKRRKKIVCLSLF